MRHRTSILVLVAALAVPAAAAAQSVDTLLIIASTRGRERAEQLMGPNRTDRGTPLYLVARAELDSGNFREASLSLVAALQRNRNNPIYNGDLGYAYARMGSWDDAGDAFAAAARLQSNNPWYIVALGAVRFGQQRWADAAGTLQLASSTDSSVVDGSFAALAAQAYENAGDRTKAGEWYQIALRKNPGDATSWIRYALILRAHEDTAGGVAATRRFLALRPGDPLGSAVYASFLSALGRTDSALHYGRIAEADTSVRMFLADAYLRSGIDLLRSRDLRRAEEVLARGQPWAPPERRALYGYYLGRTKLDLLVVKMNDLQESENCDSTRGLDSSITAVETQLRSGRAVDSSRVDLILNQILPGYRTTASRMGATFCDPARLRRQQAAPRRRP